jgi:hypothetical protein
MAMCGNGTDRLFSPELEAATDQSDSEREDEIQISDRINAIFRMLAPWGEDPIDAGRTRGILEPVPKPADF